MKGCAKILAQDDSEANSQQISFYQMSVVMANAYTNAISDNVKRSVMYKLNNGECIQRAPVGYLNVKDENGKSTVIVDKTRAPLVQDLFKKIFYWHCIFK